MKIIPKKPNLGVRFRTLRCDNYENNWTYLITGIEGKYYIINCENDNETEISKVEITKALEFFKSGYYIKI